MKDLGVSAPPLLVFGCHRGLVLSRLCQPGDLLLARVDEVSGGDGFDVGRLPAVLAPGPVPQLKRGDPSARLRLPLQQVRGGLATARARREVSEAGLACMSNLHKRLILANKCQRCMTNDYIDKQINMLSTLNILSQTLICASMPDRGDPGARRILSFEQD